MIKNYKYNYGLLVKTYLHQIYNGGGSLNKPNTIAARSYY